MVPMPDSKIILNRQTGIISLMFTTPKAPTVIQKINPTQISDNSEERHSGKFGKVKGFICVVWFSQDFRIPAI